jgi:hypothetical protein
MEQFIARHKDVVIGALEGLDRVLFRGSLTMVSHVGGLHCYLNARGVFLKGFRSWSESCTDRLIAHAQKVAQAAGRPQQYVASPSASKEDIALEIARRDGIGEGLVCVLSCVEPCQSFYLSKNRQKKKLELVAAKRRCKYLYFYYLDPEMGLLHVRLQSWVPFSVQVCLNGRSYLQRQLDKAGIRYTKRDNCFTAIADLPKAQEMMEALDYRDWSKTLNKLVAPLQPLLAKGGALDDLFYYWSVRESEYATDVMFRDAAGLEGVYPSLCRHAMERLDSPDILRFMGRTPTCRQEVSSDLKRRVRGVRVKHRAGVNSIKMYDKQGSVLRIETTINDPGMFRVFRRAQGNQRSPLLWRPMRRGVVEMVARAKAGRDANHRYLQALAVVHQPTPSHRVLDPIGVGFRKDGQSYRGLRPTNQDDADLFAAVLRGEHLINGFTNADLRNAIFGSPPRDKALARRRSSRIGRQLRLLRRHGLIQKVGARRLYRITPKGHQAMSLALALREVDASTALAA